MGSRLRAALLAGTTLVGLVLVSTVAAATPDEVAGLTFAEQQAAIARTVDSAKERWGLDLNPAEYKVVDTGLGAVVQPSGMPDIRIVKSEGPNKGSFTASLDVGADPARREERIHSKADVEWYAPRCADWITDEKNIGKMLKCWQWGVIPYNNGLRNEVYKGWASCMPTGVDAGYMRELDDCYDNTRRDPEGAPFQWQDYSPRSSTTLSTCGDVNLSISALGVSVGTVVRTCQKLNPEWVGPDAGDFGTRWVGDAYKPADVRETGQMMALSSARYTYSGLGATWGFNWSSCSPGGIIDPCG